LAVSLKQTPKQLNPSAGRQAHKLFFELDTWT